MGQPRFVSLIGLGFGDCGKGVFTDALCRKWNAHTVVRFNGGSQAGHNVVLPDGRHHTFSQFGSGTLIPGVATVLAHPVVVHPGALLVEEAHLRSIGVHDGFKRLMIDGRCRVNTPFHQAAGWLRELSRGAKAHGSCGVGFGETVDHSLQFPEHILRYSDLARPALAMQKLAQIRRDLLANWNSRADPSHDSPRFLAEWRLLSDDDLSERWLSSVLTLLRHVPPATKDQISECLNKPGTALFEGAQGVLLDEWKGFHPHTTWSSIHPHAVNAVADDYGHSGRIEHLGVLRAYLTRHGAGPFPTADAVLDILPEPHNHHHGWQGLFRRGHPDSVLLRYALEIAGPLDGLLVSHLDVFEKIRSLKWCEAYAKHGMDGDVPRSRLPANIDQNLAYQAELTSYMFGAKPIYAPWELKSPASLMESLEHTCDCPIWFGAYGPNHQTVFASKVNVRRQHEAPE